MKRELEVSLARAFTSVPEFARVDRESALVDRMFPTMMQACADSYRLARGEYLILLEHALHFTLNYLCQPQRTLTSFLIPADGRAPRAQVLERLGSFVEYRYLPSLVERLLRQAPGDEVRLDELRAMVARADGAVVRQHSPREMVRLLQPLFALLLTGRPPEATQIPLAPVLRFLEDKNLISMRDYVQDIMHVRGQNVISAPELVEILEDMLTPPLSAVRPPAAMPQEETEPTAEYVPELPPEEPQEFETAAPAQVAAPEPVAETPGTIEFVPPEPAVAETIEPPQGTSGLPDIMTVMTEEQREVIGRKVFGSDVDFFVAIVGNLDGMRSWSEASEYLREVYSITGVDPFQPEAIEFTDVVHRRFRGTPQV
jgi:hypothetical protein